MRVVLYSKIQRKWARYASAESNRDKKSEGKNQGKGGGGGETE